MIKIAVIGAGNIGSRHLQALALLDRNAQIEVLDQNAESLQIAKVRFEAVLGSREIKKVLYVSRVDDLSEDLDLAVIATAANVRRNVVEALLGKKSVRFLILEKVLFQKTEDYFAIAERLKEKNVKAWVNCPRRMWPIYKGLKKKLEGAGCASFLVAGAQIGLGCNGIHFIDLFSFLGAGERYEISSDGLDAGIIESKRAGFIELSGALHGEFGKNKPFMLVSHKQGATPFLVQISAENLRVFVDENSGQAWISEAVDNWQWVKLDFKVLFQSQLTHLAVQQILDEGESALTPYAESMQLHLPFIKALMKHLAQYAGKEQLRCPIT